jgi:hypothetical protein
MDYHANPPETSTQKQKGRTNKFPFFEICSTFMIEASVGLWQLTKEPSSAELCVVHVQMLCDVALLGCAESSVWVLIRQRVASPGVQVASAKISFSWL